jgi:hypothetical protein
LAWCVSPEIWNVEVRKGRRNLDQRVLRREKLLWVKYKSPAMAGLLFLSLYIQNTKLALVNVQTFFGKYLQYCQGDARFEESRGA